jgi:hypothetical protein
MSDRTLTVPPARGSTGRRPHLSSEAYTPRPWQWTPFGKRTDVHTHDWYELVGGPYGTKKLVLGAGMDGGGLWTSPVLFAPNEKGGVCPVDPGSPDAKLIAAAPILLEALEWIRTEALAQRVLHRRPCAPTPAASAGEVEEWEAWDEVRKRCEAALRTAGVIP